MACIPLAFASNDWYTLSFIASKLGVPTRTARLWAYTGLFTRMGLKIVYLSTKGISTGTGATRIWVNIPFNCKRAMFSKVKLDNLPSSSISC